MSEKRILITCPPMQRSIDRYRDTFAKLSLEPFCPEMTQVLTENELISILPDCDGWIIGDDPATSPVFQAGVNGRLRAAVKWGVGVDNVDFEGAASCGLRISNTPGMFSDEVADVAMSYVIGLARELFLIDAGVKNRHWPKPVGMSLRGKTAAIVGMGDIGCATALRLSTIGMTVFGYDPAPKWKKSSGDNVELLSWPNQIGAADFIVLCCALNSQTHHIIDEKTLEQCKQGVRIVNVSRGPLICESALAAALSSGRVHSAALEVFETEPLPDDSPLRNSKRCLFGSHNASNTQEAVDRTSETAIGLLQKQFEANQ